LWQSGSIQDIGTIQFYRMSLPDHINDVGDIVGSALDPGQLDPTLPNYDRLAVLWKDGVNIDLNRLAPASPFDRLERATTINNGGVIAGYGIVPIDVGFRRRGFILWPCTLRLDNGRLINSDSQFQFELTGPNNRSYTVEASDDLATWSSITSGTFPSAAKSV